MIFTSRLRVRARQGWAWKISPTRLKTKKMVIEKNPVRHFLRIQQAFGQEWLDNANWLPDTENPSGGLTRVRNDIVPHDGYYNRGGSIQDHCGPMGGSARREGGNRVQF